LTAGPTEGDTVRYNVPISWAGEDADGSVVRYEYAIDPNSSFSEDEIANGGPGIVSKLIKGQDGAPDTTRVTGESGVSFDWIHTTDARHRFQFSTPVADSVYDGTLLLPTGRFFGMHAVYVRAVDDDGAFSIPDKVAFTAKTIAPRSKITHPLIGDETLVLTDSLRSAWRGVDPDGVQRKPIGFLIALAVDPCSRIICIPEIGSPQHYLGNTSWRFVNADTPSVTLPLESGLVYIFGVRAVDENGAVEPFLDWNRNAIRFLSRPGTLQPVLSVAYQGQVVTFPRSSPSPSFQLPAKRDAIIDLSCSAEQYGETCDGFRWALDLPDLDNWEAGWSTQTQIRLHLLAGTHVLYVEARDSLGNITLATIIVHVIDMAFDREVLLIDDSLDNLYPTDSEHDAFWNDLIQSYASTSGIPAEQISEFSVFGEGDRGSLEPKVPILSELARYKVLIWENLGSGYNSDSALYRATVMSPLLATYLQAGGKLWLGGRMTVAATTGNYPGTGADLAYPKTELDAGDWAWDFLKLHSSKINNDKGTNNASLFHAARWFPRAMGGHMPAIYDTMSVDLDKLNMFQKSYGGFSHADAVFDPNFAESEPDFRGDIDTLYAYGATGPEVQGKTSQYQNKLCALRWHDPDPDRAHGRIQWFGFAIYFMHEAQAEQTFKQSLDWFREEMPPIP